MEQKINEKEEIGISIEIPASEEALMTEGIKEEHTTVQAWDPKTQIGREVKSGKIKNIDEILLGKKRILEPEIVDSLVTLDKDLILVGQSKGKFGGGKRRAASGGGITMIE